jgi:hypothetical protein
MAVWLLDIIPPRYLAPPPQPLRLRQIRIDIILLVLASANDSAIFFTLKHAFQQT